VIKEDFIQHYEGVYKDIMNGEKESKYERKDELNLHDKKIYVVLNSGHYNYITRQGENPNLDSYANYDEAFRDMFTDNVYIIGSGFNFKNMSDYPPKL
jgi:hypothetical protein